jgi:nucleotide-binding universal stress UspA family protein
MSEIRSIPSIPTKTLLPIDFSPSSQAALEMAADLAKHFHAELCLVNVIPFFPTTTLPDMSIRRAASDKMPGGPFDQRSQVQVKRRGWK